MQAANGTVTLSGNVDTDAQREAASKYAASEAGVKQVINNLQVAPVAAASEAAPEAAEEASPAPVQRRTSKPSAASRRHARRSAPVDQPQMKRRRRIRISSLAGSPGAIAGGKCSGTAASSEPQKVTVPSGTLRCCVWLTPSTARPLSLRHFSRNA